MKAKEKVKILLNKYPHFKDSDNKLIAAYWFEELKRKGLNPDKINVLDFLHLFADSKITNPETIRRSRAKLQEEDSSLRGKNYSLRKGAIQDKWRKDLGYDNYK
tara:strand:+ start:2848 stop:3159 length:312 start_codon:yes stop_codon:yes gene_type:complete